MIGMKKLSVIIALLSAAALFAGCSGSAGSGVSVVGKVTEPSSAAVSTTPHETVETTTVEATTVEPTTEEQTTAPDYGSELFGKLTNTFIFASGAGAWSTQLNIHEDGSFDGNFHDSDMGVRDDAYPHGTLTYCDFTGKFGEVNKVNDYTYSMKMLDIEYADEPGTEEIKDGYKYKYFSAYGLDEADELLVYTPDAPVSELPEKYLGWIRGVKNTKGTTLDSYGIYNVNEEEGFIESNH